MYNSLVKRMQHGNHALLSYEELATLENGVIPLLTSALHSSQEQNHAKATTMRTTLRDISPNLKNVTTKRWKDFIRDYLKRLQIDRLLPAVITNRDFFEGFLSLVDELGDPKMAWFTSWCFVFYAALLTDVDSVLTFYGARGISLMRHRESCLTLTSSLMGYALQAGYIASIFKPAVRKDIHATADRIVRSVSWHLGLSSVETRENSTSIYSTVDSLLQLVDLATSEALDETYSVFGDMTDTTVINVGTAVKGVEIIDSSETTSTAFLRFNESSYYFYSPEWNSTVIAVDVFAMSTYHIDVPEAVKYGILGPVLFLGIARILTNDDRYVEHGLFETKLLRFADCPNPNMLGLVETHKLLPDHVYFAVSIKFLWTVFAALKESDPVRLRYLPDISGDQLFFVFWCYIHCGHRLAKAICNDARRDMVFARVFACAPVTGFRDPTVCRAFNSAMVSNII